jgi:hypothetical protein
LHLAHQLKLAQQQLAQQPWQQLEQQPGQQQQQQRGRVQ